MYFVSDLKVENLLLDENKDIKIIGKCLFHDILQYLYLMRLNVLMSLRDVFRRYSSIPFWTDQGK